MKMNERSTSELYDNGILVQRSRQVSNSIIYRAMFYGLLSERDTIKRWVPSYKTWSLTLIVLRFTEIECKCFYYSQCPPGYKRAGTQTPIDY